jgi:PAS domain S-box-containing protein
VDVITRTDKNLRLSYVSPSSKRTFGFSPEEILGFKHQADMIHPDFYRGLKRDFDDMVMVKKPTKFIYRALCSNGNYIWVESNVNPIFEENSGELLELISVIRDISDHIDQETALNESTLVKEMLIREIHHRAKNNLSILVSLMNFQMEQSSNAELHACLADLQFRVRTLALIHELLFKSKNINILSIKEYLSNISSTVTSVFRKNGIMVHIDIEDCFFDVSTALPLGLIINELLTNAYKYAFTTRESGNIWIKFENLPKNGTEQNQPEFLWSLSVRDDGVGLPENYSFNITTSLGTQIIDILINQLQANLIINREEGVCFTILIPYQK